MSELTQAILATGVAAFLILLATAGVIWALRCHARSERYRYPLVLSLPLMIGAAAALERLL